jgi:hypothetical protein
VHPQTCTVCFRSTKNTARCADIDLENQQRAIVKIKSQTPHIAQLATQAVEIPREVNRVTGYREYAFSSARSPWRSMSDDT